MSAITTIFCDVGGVILTNGWDREGRIEAEARFGLDHVDFEDRHELAFPAFEVGQATLDQYLERTVFYRTRSFTPQEFKDFIFVRSQELHPSRLLLDRVAATRKYLVVALNNEGAELNAYRILRFSLRRTFNIFLSSCYVGMRKPNAPIYQLALNVAQCKPAECVFIDDRPVNLESPKQLGINTILFQNAAQLEADLRSLGVELGAA